MTAYAAIPFFKPSSWTASLVIDAVPARAGTL